MLTKKSILTRFFLTALICCAAGFAAPSVGEAQGLQGRSFGAGIMLGEPSGLTVKQWLNPSNAFDVHLAFDFSDEDFAIFSDYLYHFDAFRLRSKVQVELPLYVGIGGKLRIDARSKGREDDAEIKMGVRIPVGIAILFKKVPLEIFFEVAPGLDIFPSTNPEVDGGLGVRYYF